MLKDPFRFINVPKDIVCEFFAVFSRFEFALKESGFVREERRAAPDWKRFQDGFALAIPHDGSFLYEHCCKKA